MEPDNQPGEQSQTGINNPALDKKGKVTRKAITDAAQAWTVFSALKSANDKRIKTTPRLQNGTQVNNLASSLQIAFCFLLLIGLGTSTIGGVEHSTDHPSTTISDSKEEDWYQTPPDVAGGPLLLPISTERLVIPLSADVRNTAIARLADSEAIPLTKQDSRSFGIPYEPDQLIRDQVRENQKSIGNCLRYLKMNPFGPESSAAPMRRGLANDKKYIAHWKHFEGIVRPYLVRALGTKDVDGKFYATVWHRSLTISESSFVMQPEVPRHDRVSIGPAALGEVQKMPVVVYLTTRPAHVYTTVSIIRGY